MPATGDAVRTGSSPGLVIWERPCTSRPSSVPAARVAGIARISLEARFSNVDARNFYARLGYSQAELLPGYYGGRETSVRMAKELGSTQKGIA